MSNFRFWLVKIARLCYTILITNTNRWNTVGFFDIVNVWGLVFAALLTAPHIIFVRTRRYNKEVFTNRAMLYIARIGRFFSAFLMAFNIGVLEQGFTEPRELMQRFWLIVCAALVGVCLLLWGMFFKTESRGAALAISLISAFVVIFSGILQVKILLCTAGLVYVIGELYLWFRFFSER